MELWEAAETDRHYEHATSFVKMNTNIAPIRQFSDVLYRSFVHSFIHLFIHSFISFISGCRLKSHRQIKTGKIYSKHNI